MSSMKLELTQRIIKNLKLFQLCKIIDENTEITQPEIANQLKIAPSYVAYLLRKIDPFLEKKFVSFSQRPRIALSFKPKFASFIRELIEFVKCEEIWEVN